jgi:hypothetical protein
MEKTIKLSEIQALKDQGYELIRGIDAAKANSDHFAIMEKVAGDGTRSIRILCPTFLRGSIGFAKVSGGISY